MRILAICITLLALPVQAEELIREKACKTVSRIYLQQLRESMEGCEWKLVHLKAELRHCGKTKLKDIGSDTKEIDKLKKECKDSQLANASKPTQN